MNVGQEDSPYLVKLGSLERPLSEVPERFTVPKPWQARWYFFYDTLMQPSELSKILQLPETPLLRPAFVKSYTLATYQQSKVLLDEGPISNVVSGMAYLVRSEAEEITLVSHETNACINKSVKIWFSSDEEPSSTIGWAFVFNGDPAMVDHGVN
jgi:hypothetical protein